MKRPLVAVWLTSLLLLLLGTNFWSNPSSAQSAQGAPPAGKVSADLRHRVAVGRGRDRVRVIIQPAARSWDEGLGEGLRASGAENVRPFKNFNFRVATLPAAAAAALASRPDVAYVSLNREVGRLGHVSLTTGADAVRVSNGTNVSGLDGTGVGIAVLDSGIDTTHRAFLDKSNGLRVIASQDFTGEGRTDDPYGHGTHVASLLAGNGRISNAQYVGIAPNASVVNLRVLNSAGTGTVSGLLRALDWVLTNRAAFNIRVVNMSLGAPAIDSYKNDPVCQAVRRLVDAGLVVVAAAGNNGKDANGRKVYGHIHSPGNEPSALTVGASNTFGTDSRADDGVASYSSRGPTRSSWADAAGARHYDNLVKPDLVA
ncbi:MAG TPA: S8 family serine peptidase, partial [Pyrinomonadaceae bacterium]|nr:S8 family serine peptidase [Pyrinomonadaceae bacterium]